MSRYWRGNCLNEKEQIIKRHTRECYQLMLHNQFLNWLQLPDVLMPKFCCSPSDTNCQSMSPSIPCISSLSRRATSGFMDAAFITGPMTNGRYCSNCFPVNYMGTLSLSKYFWKKMYSLHQAPNSTHFTPKWGIEINSERQYLYISIWFLSHSENVVEQVQFTTWMSLEW